MKLDKLFLAGALLVAGCGARENQETTALAQTRDQVGDTFAEGDSAETAPNSGNPEPEKLEGPNDNLFKSVHNLDKEGVNNAIANGADINAIDAGGHTPLMIAIHSNNTDFVTFLISEKGADVNVQREGGMTSLMAAAYYSDINMARLLVKNGADIFGHNQFGQNAISFAHGRNEEVFIFLLRKLGVSRKKIDSMIKDPEDYYLTDKPPYVRRVESSTRIYRESSD